MSTLKNILHVLVLLAATGVLGELGWFGWKMQRPVTDMVSEWHETAIEERGNFDAQLKETRKATADVHDLLIHTDLALNGTRSRPGLIPQATKTLIGVNLTVAKLSDAIDAQNAALSADSASLRASLEGITDSERQLNGILGQISVQTGQIGPILENVSKSSQSTADMTKALAGTAQDVQGYVHYEVKELEKPEKLIWRIFKNGLTLGGSAAQIFK